MTDRQRFTLNLFDLLKEVDYVLLKHIEDSIEELNEQSDLDILISRASCKKVLAWLKTSNSLKKIRFSRKSTMVQAFLFFKDQSFLQLDFLYGFYRKELHYISEKEVFEHAVKTSDGVSVCSPRHLLEHLLLFNFLNLSGIQEKYIQYFKNWVPIEKAALLDYLNEKYYCRFSRFEDLGIYSEQLREKLIQSIKKRKANKGIRGVTNQLIYYKDILKSIWTNRGFTITFSGVDGAGKSTILSEVKTILEEKYRRNVVVLRHRPSLLPILSSFRYGRKTAEARAASTLPRRGTNKSRMSSFIRFLYYYSDFVLGQFYIKAKYLWRGYIVLYDRYYFDFIVDPKRSNIQLDQALPRFLYHFVHHPRLNLFLYAKPETILKRKQELDKHSIKELTENYKALFDSLGNGKQGKYLPIENVDKRETLKQIIDQYETLA